MLARHCCVESTYTLNPKPENPSTLSGQGRVVCSVLERRLLRRLNPKPETLNPKPVLERRLLRHQLEILQRDRAQPVRIKLLCMWGAK